MKLRPRHWKWPRFVMGFLAGIMLTGVLAFRPDYFEVSKHLDLFTNVVKQVSLYYVDDTEPSKLIQKAIEEMLSNLDPYTTYIPEEKVEDFRIQQTGSYGGIGAGIRSHKGKVLIANVYKGFPADQAEILIGDELLSVDTESMLDRSTDEVSEILKGAAGTKLNLRLRRAQDTFSLRLEREKIHVNSVPYAGHLAEGIGYIRLSSFTRNASQEIEKAWDDLEQEKELQALVLDLRNNPGGLLAEAINVSNLFIPEGETVVETRGKLEEWTRNYRTQNKEKDAEIPLIVLINSASASASEIVAGTVQDYDRGIVMGQRSFGKGLVQETRKLPYGAQIKITIAKYFTPSGRLIQAIDYAERDEDGSVKRVPDSLRSRFETINGRAVFDGGGIDPDIKIQAQPPEDVVVELVRDMHIFHFATQYRYQHDSLGSPREFSISPQEFKAFQSWLKDRDFSFETSTDQVLEKLGEVADNDGYGAKMTDQLQQIQEQLQKLKADDINQYAPTIRELLTEEIVSRYHYKGGRIASSLEHDPIIDSARNVLRNSQRYRSILKPDED